MIPSTVFGIVASLAFLLLLLVATVSDIRDRRVPNSLVAVLLISGLAVAVLLSGPAALGPSLLAAAIGFAIWIPFYAFRMLGAGDVKLFAAAAAWLPPLQVIDAAILAAFVGGTLSVCWIFYESRNGSAAVVRILHAARYRQVLVRTEERRRKLPYAVAMSIGLSLSFFGIGLL